MSESRDSEVLPGLPRHAGARWTLGAVPQGLRTLPGDSDVRCGPSSQHRAHPTRHPGPERLPSRRTVALCPLPSVPVSPVHFHSLGLLCWEGLGGTGLPAHAQGCEKATCLGPSHGDICLNSTISTFQAFHQHLCWICHHKRLPLPSPQPCTTFPIILKTEQACLGASVSAGSQYPEPCRSVSTSSPW